MTANPTKPMSDDIVGIIVQESFLIVFRSEAVTSRTTSTVIFCALVCALCGAVLAQPAFPSQDGPLHLYYARILGDLTTGSATWGGYFVRRPGFPPYMLHNLILLAAQAVVPPLVAEKILVVLCITALCFGFRYAVHALRPEATWSTLFIFPVALHKSLYMGFYNFSLGLGIMLFLCGVWLRNDRPFQARHAILFVAGVMLLAVTHPIPLILTLCFVALDLTIGAAGKRPPGKWRVSAAVMSSLTLIYIGLYSYRTRTPDLPDLQLVVNHLGSTLDAIWPMRTALEQVIRIVVTIGAVALAAFVKQRRSGPRSAVLLFSIACGLAYVVAPNNVNGADFFHERFAMSSFLFLLLYCAAIELQPRTAALLGISAGVFSLLLTADQIARLRPFAEQAAQLDSMRPARANERGIVLSARGAIGPPEFNFSPCLHISAHYFRRAHAVLVNSCWLHMPITAIRPRLYEPYHFLDPQFMTAYGIRHINRLPKVDFVVAEQCPPGSVDRGITQLVRLYTEHSAAALHAGCITVYDVRPELSARWSQRDRSAETGRP